MQNITFNYIEVGCSLGVFTRIMQSFTNKDITFNRSAVYVRDDINFHIHKELLCSENVYYIKDAVGDEASTADIMFLSIRFEYVGVRGSKFNGTSKLGDSVASIKILKANKPKVAIIELPTHSVKADNVLAYKVLIRILRDLGYTVNSRELDGNSFGDIQNKHKVIVIASLDKSIFKWPAPAGTNRLLCSILLDDGDSRLGCMSLTDKKINSLVKSGNARPPLTYDSVTIQPLLYPSKRARRQPVLKQGDSYRFLHPVEFYRSLVSIKDDKTEEYLSNLPLLEATRLLSQTPNSGVLKAVLKSIPLSYFYESE
jgi:hypothetical protein